VKENVSKKEPATCIFLSWLQTCDETMGLLGLTIHDKTTPGLKIFSLHRRQKDKARMHANVPAKYFTRVVDRYLPVQDDSISELIFLFTCGDRVV
jgi:hypothetical protein